MGSLILRHHWKTIFRGKVKTWYANCDPEDLFLSVLVVGEIRQGIERLRRRDPVQAERIELRLADVQSMMQGRIFANIFFLFAQVFFGVKSPHVINLGGTP
jgi:predicted nucleic acid-binding protein